MNALPERAECRSLLQDGSVATITATRRPRGERADIKCSIPGADRLAERMQQVVRLARHTEASFDSRDQVVLSMDRAPSQNERDWEFAAVLADRLVRGVWHSAAPVLANGWSDQWQLGRIDGHALDAPGAILGGEVGFLGALSGQPDAAACVASMRCWFPLHSGGVHDALCWVEVSVFPLSHGEEDPISAPGAPLDIQLAVRETLAAARLCDGRATGRWRAVVRFGQPRFQGRSFELALVMADRMARGRDFLARGRIIASGSSSAWQAGKVEAVDGCAAKCALILAEAVSGDRVLLPKAWETDLPVGFAAQLRAKGASFASVERIGLI
jgi:hypothetical protein